jgi:hypothetical protein
MPSIVQVTNLNGFIKGVNTLIVKKKKVKAKKKVSTKKAKVKKGKEEIVRVSPFNKGDLVWVNRGMSFSKSTITKCIKPGKSERAWSYITEFGTIEEGYLYPASIFSMMATDANRMKVASMNDSLNNTFDGTAIILEIYRVGQKRPWAYYVIPDPAVIQKTINWNIKSSVYGYAQNKSATIYIKPVSEITLKLIPISSSAHEILTYLGLHIYNRKWLKTNE